VVLPAGLVRLSLSYQLLVALARPDATLVARFKSWLRLGYRVRKGENAIRIIALLPVEECDRVTGEQTGETLVCSRPYSSSTGRRSPRSTGRVGAA